jgi:hypothetical protein
VDWKVQQHQQQIADEYDLRRYFSVMAFKISPEAVPKFSLLSAGIHGRLLNEENEQKISPPKPLSARSKASQLKPKRPSSANPRIRSSQQHPTRNQKNNADNIPQKSRPEAHEPSNLDLTSRSP